MTVLLIRVILVGLAAYRLARALSIDSISAPFRDWLWVGVYGEDAEGDDPEPVGGVFWRWAYGLVSCPFCCSWWFALGLFLAWQHSWSVACLVGAIASAGAAAAFVSLDRAAARD